MPKKLTNAQHVMIDLETLALDEHALVFSIGVIIYDGQWNEMSAFSANLDIQEQKELYHRHVDANTEQWWSRQDISIWNMCTKNTLTLDVGLELLVDFLYDKLEDPNKSYYWGNSAIFDLLKINSLFRSLNSRNERYPFKSIKERTLKFNIDEYFMRCYKSVRDVFRDYFSVKHINKNVTHFPIDDARTQGDYMRAITNLKCQKRAPADDLVEAMNGGTITNIGTANNMHIGDTYFEQTGSKTIEFPDKFNNGPINVGENAGKNTKAYTTYSGENVINRVL